MTLHYCTPSVSLFYMDVETDNQYKEPKVNTKIILLGKGRSHENKLRSSFGFCPNYRNFNNINRKQEFPARKRKSFVNLSNQNEIRLC